MPASTLYRLHALKAGECQTLVLSRLMIFYSRLGRPADVEFFSAALDLVAATRMQSLANGTRTAPPARDVASRDTAPSATAASG